MNFVFCYSDRDGVAKVDQSHVYILLGDLIALFNIMRAFYLCCLAPFRVLKSWWAHFQSDVTQLTAFELYHEGAFVSHLYQIPLRTEENQTESSSQNDFFSPEIFPSDFRWLLQVKLEAMSFLTSQRLIYCLILLLTQWNSVSNTKILYLSRDNLAYLKCSLMVYIL